MAGLKEIMSLQWWLKTGHKPQRGNQDPSRDDPHMVGAENLNSLCGQLVVGLWFLVAAWLYFPKSPGV
jgi:hypothetical protein